MKIHGICLVKNESDILRYFLRESARWCDRIYIYDNGSTDGTWELACEIARESPRVIPFKQEGKPFRDHLRGEVFRRYRGDAVEGDWWCRLDADEVYIDDPPAFLARVPRSCHVVWSAHLQYMITEKDLPRFRPEDEVKAPEATVETLPRHYIANASEARFFRHRNRLRWDETSWPTHMGLVSPERIRVKHLQYRSPAQIARRLSTRHTAAQRGYLHFEHETQQSWREKIADSSGLHFDAGDGRYVVDPAQLPNHLEPRWVRAMKRVMHGCGFWA